MTAPTKTNALREQGAGLNQSDYGNGNSTATASRTKALIVGAGCWGLLSVKLSEWLIRCFRLGAA